MATVEFSDDASASIEQVGGARSAAQRNQGPAVHWLLLTAGVQLVWIVGLLYLAYVLVGRAA
jgi:hypothetical protein